MAKDYSKDQLVQKSVADLLANELSWTAIQSFSPKLMSEEIEV